MPFLADRSGRSDRHLEWKVGIFSVAAVLVLAGIYLEERWMTGAAIVVLAGAMVLRFAPEPAHAAEAPDDAEALSEQSGEEATPEDGDTPGD